MKKGKETLKKEKILLKGIESEKVLSNLELKLVNSSGTWKKKPLKRGKPNEQEGDFEEEGGYKISERRKNPTAVRKYKTRRRNKPKKEEK